MTIVSGEAAPRDLTPVQTPASIEPNQGGSNPMDERKQSRHPDPLVTTTWHATAVNACRWCCTRTLVLLAALLSGTGCQSNGVEHYHSHIYDQHRDPASSMERAGCPRCVAPWAQPFPDAKYSSYYVGGGAPLYGDTATVCHGECRCVNEGTFGVDYDPWYSRVRSQWYHGKRHQGGEGQHEPDHKNNPFDDYLGFGPFKRAPLIKTR